MVCTEAVGWQVEGKVNFGPNVVSFLLMSGPRQWYVVGAYVTLNNEPVVHCVEQELKAAPKGVEVIILGDLNVRPRNPHKYR